MSPWPVLRVDTFFGVMNLIIDEYVFIFSVEEDVYGFVGLSGDVVEVVAGGELVDVKRVPDGVVKHHYWLFVQDGDGLFEFLGTFVSDGDF